MLCLECLGEFDSNRPYSHLRSHWDISNIGQFQVGLTKMCVIVDANLIRDIYAAQLRNLDRMLRLSLVSAGVIEELLPLTDLTVENYGLAYAMDTGNN